MDADAWSWEGRRIDTGDGHQSVVDVGEGPPVLFVHGTPTWSYDWRHLIRALAPNHRCVAPDHLGFGRSDRPKEAGYRPEDHAGRLVRLVEALDLRRVTLVMHDYGGPIGLPLTLERDRVARIVLLNTFCWDPAGDPDLRLGSWLGGTWLFRLLYRWLNFSVRGLAFQSWGDRRKLTPEIRRQVLAPWADPDGRERVLWALARGLRGSAPFYESLWAQRAAWQQLPALLVWGMADPAFRPSALARWRAALPHAEVLELAGAGHWPQEEEPERVAAAIGSFAARALLEGERARAELPQRAVPPGLGDPPHVGDQPVDRR